ncbi:MAG: alpha/beta fold hydrolase, partial [Methylomonas sp.]
KTGMSNCLLLRGLSREAGHWGEFVPQMQTALPNVKVNTLDLPGTGRFYQQTSPNRIDAILQATRQQALQDGLLKQPIHLLAVSLGGMVAWEWLQRYPQEIESAILVNTSFANLSRFYQRLRWQAYSQLVGALTSHDTYQRELAIVRMVSNRADCERQIIARAWAKLHQQHPISLSTSLKQITAAARYKPTLSRPQLPVLLLNSLGDRLVSANCSVAIQQRYQLPLHSHPNAGHDLALDAPEWLIEQAVSWLQNLPPSHACNLENLKSPDLKLYGI